MCAPHSPRPGPSSRQATCPRLPAARPGQAAGAVLDPVVSLLYARWREGGHTGKDDSGAALPEELGETVRSPGWHATLVIH